jgi:hypothetical protein
VIVAFAIDLIWTLIAILGILVSGWALFDSFLDGKAQTLSGENGTLRAIVRGNQRSAQASLLLHSFFLLLGLLAFQSLESQAVQSSQASFIIFAAGYILVAATNVRAVALNQLERVRLRNNR